MFNNEKETWNSFSNDSVYVVPNNVCLKFWNLISFVQFLNDLRINEFISSETMFFASIISCYAGEAYANAIDTITKVDVSFDEFFDSLVKLLEKYGIDHESIQVPDIKDGCSVEMVSPCNSSTYRLYKEPGRYFPRVVRI